MTKPEVRVRAATAADVGTIVAFIRELADYEQLSHEVVATDETIGEWLFGPRPAAEVAIAEIDGRAAGFALYFMSFSTFLGQPGIYLEDLFVQPDSRGAGVGKALLAHVAGLACERNCGRLEWAVLNWNESAIGFYERLGARPMDEWTTYRVAGDELRAMARSKA